MLILAGVGAGPVVGDYYSIATTTLSSSTATITFSSIPATYKHLQIRGITRLGSSTTGTNDIFIRFNSDTAANYSRHALYGTGATAATNGAGSTTSAYAARAVSPRATSTANAFGVFIVDILDYANTNKNKTVRCLGGTDQNGSGEVYLTSGVWMNTDAINEIDIVPNIGTTFVQYTQFALYGIKG